MKKVIVSNLIVCFILLLARLIVLATRGSFHVWQLNPAGFLTRLVWCISRGRYWTKETLCNIWLDQESFSYCLSMLLFCWMCMDWPTCRVIKMNGTVFFQYQPTTWHWLSVNKQEIVVKGHPWCLLYKTMTTRGGMVCGHLNSHPWLLNNLWRQLLRQVSLICTNLYSCLKCFLEQK